MGVTVGAALKKVAAALLSDPKVLKKVATAELCRRLWCFG